MSCPLVLCSADPLQTLALPSQRDSQIVVTEALNGALSFVGRTNGEIRYGKVELGENPILYGSLHWRGLQEFCSATQAVLHLFGDDGKRPSGPSPRKWRHRI